MEESLNMVDLATARLALTHYIDADIPTFLWGPPGVGKSEMVHQETTSRKTGSHQWAMNDFRAILRDPVDLRGIPAADMKIKKAIWLTPDDLPDEKRDGKYGILFLDELNAAHQQVQAACFGLVLDRKLGDYRLPEGWRIIAAGNRQSDRSAAQRMPRALANRFAHIEVQADAQTWVDDYASKKCHPLVTAFIRFRPNLIHVMDGDDERMFPTPRSWAQVSKVANAPDSTRFINVRGLVGAAAATEFEAFVKTYRQLPDINDIIANPKKADVPDEPSALFAVSTALGKFADRDNFGNIMTYAQRLSREYEIIVALDASKREPSMTKTRTYIDFVQRNKDIQIGNFRTHVNPNPPAFNPN